MIFEYMIMKNYRQFKDSRLDFAIPNGNRNITVVFAKNGIGKSDLLNAVEYCVYGVEKHLTEKSTALPIINTETEKELKINESCDVIVEIFAHDEDDNNRRVRFRRVQTFRKLASGDVTLVSHVNANSGTSRFDVSEQEDKNWATVLNSDDFISEMAPEKLSEFFFYDGERLDGLFKDVSSKNIREQVEKISQINILEKMANNVKYVNSLFVNESINLNIKTSGVRKKLNDLGDSQKKQMDTLKSLKDERDYHEREENKYSGFLGNHKDVKDLVARRHKLEEDIKRIEHNLKDMKNQKLNHIISNAVHVLASKPIAQTHKIIQSKRAAKEIPRYDKEFLIELQQSICPECPLHGSDSLKDDKHRNYLGNLLKSYDNISELSVELIEVDAFLMMIMDGTKTFKGKLVPLDKHIDGLERDLIEKSEELGQISGRIKRTGEENNEENLIFWEDKKIEAFGLKRGTEDKIAILKEDIKRIEEKINKENINMKKELAKDERNELLIKKLDFCDKAIRGIEKIKNEIMQGVRKELEEKTGGTFLDFMELHGKKGIYTAVKIPDDYSINVVYNITGRQGRGSLSQGERQMLAYSYMCALNSVSGFCVPIIIDTPMGGLDNDNKKIIASHLPSLLKGKQLTMLLRDDEYTDDVRDKLYEYVGKEYTMNFEGGITKIILLRDNNMYESETM